MTAALATENPIEAAIDMKRDVLFLSQIGESADAVQAAKAAFEGRCVLTATETARLLGMGEKTLAGHVARGHLAFVVLGHGTRRPRRRFTLQDVLAFLENRKRVMRPERPATLRVHARATMENTSRVAR